MISSHAVERIAKLMPLLASDKEGEVINAARAMVKALRRENRDLHDVVRLIASPQTTIDPFGEASSAWSDILRKAAEAEERAARGRAEADEKRKRAEETRWAAYFEEQRREAEARLTAAIAEFGPEEAAFAETPEETRLATGPVAFPATVIEQVAEWQFWQDLATRRRRYDDSFEDSEIVSDRVDGLEQCITSTPARTWADLDARLHWLKNALATGQRTTWVEDDIAQYELLARDLTRLRRTPRSAAKRRREACATQSDFFERTSQ
ncbi:hypothetical protein G8E10_17605 [Rhizobiaceae bacterium CRRU44]|uniref:Uncharacterized protein n=1 Tax=Ferranicluibacter rubi TaxID=2715133 RepID=A0AA43ZGP0_9HYPH|nr:hypothetical protein [Ferranicluibacter rubi]NHT77533.1 hypothetical protein [Ferranicluibacter rubi]